MAITKEITPKSSMQEILEAYPSAQRALFTRYHIGGCSSCGFQPTDTLEEVLENRDIPDAEEVIAHIKQSQDVEERIQISPKELQELLEKGSVKLIDLRSTEERRMVHIEGDLEATEELVQEIMEKWSKDAPIVLYCHLGDASLEATSFLIGHDFTNVKCLAGGINAWSKEIDPLLPQY